MQFDQTMRIDRVPKWVHHIHKAQTQKNHFFGAALVHFVERSITIRKIDNLCAFYSVHSDYNSKIATTITITTQRENDSLPHTHTHTQAVDLSCNPLIWSRLFGKLVFDGKRKLVTYFWNRLHFIWQMFTKWYYQDVTQHGLQHVRKQVKAALYGWKRRTLKWRPTEFITYDLIQQQLEINEAN